MVPVAFVILFIGFLVVGLALWTEVTLDPPLWLHFLIWIPLALVLSLVALRVFKGLLIALQYRNRAAEGRLDGAMSQAERIVRAMSRRAADPDGRRLPRHVVFALLVRSEPGRSSGWPGRKT
jgi:hypothetical protein